MNPFVQRTVTSSKSELVRHVEYAVILIVSTMEASALHTT